jgi:adenylate cyclase
MRLLTEALALAQNMGGHWYEAELHRLTGALLLRQGVGVGFKPGPTRTSMLDGATRRATGRSTRVAEAEVCFGQALDVARRQHAKSLELRASLSLSRLWQQQGECDRARELLAGVYGWFTEGFGTTDLQEAGAVLAEL